jgi:hypothetical protein
MIQVHIDDRFDLNGLDLFVYEKLGETHMRFFQGSGMTMDVEVMPGAVLPRYPIHIPREAAGPLFAALGKILGSVENPEMLRKDYEHERTRVDKFIDAVIGGRIV